MNSEIKYIVDKNIVSLRLDRALTLLNKYKEDNNENYIK